MRHEENGAKKSTNKRAGKIAVTALACGAVFAGGAVLMSNGIRAYLTDADTATNTFTVGEVTIDTLEPNYPGNGSDEVKDLVPMEEVKKDPQIKNSGKNRAIVFSTVEIPMANIIVADEQGFRGDQQNQEIFNFRVNDKDFGAPPVNSWHDEWIQLTSLNGFDIKPDGIEYLDANGKATSKDAAVVARRYFGYSTVLDENETTVPVFDVVRLCNVIEDQLTQPDGAAGPGDVTNGTQSIANKMLDNTTQNIKITSYAIQAENIAGLTSADFDSVMDASKLSEVFAVYMNQSAGVKPGDADTSKDQTLIDTTLNVSFTVKNTHLKLNTGNAADAKTTSNYKVAYTGSGTKPTPTFTSSDTSVVTVDASGNIQAVGVGEAVIEMRATNPDNDKDAVATVTVTVRDVNSGSRQY